MYCIALQGQMSLLSLVSEHRIFSGSRLHVADNVLVFHSAIILLFSSLDRGQYRSLCELISCDIYMVSGDYILWRGRRNGWLGYQGQSFQWDQCQNVVPLMKMILNGSKLIFFWFYVHNFNCFEIIHFEGICRKGHVLFSI